MALTDIQVTALQPWTKAYRIADASGLCLEASPNGRKLWRFRYRLQAKANMLVRGVYPQVSLKQARLARDEAHLKLAQGVNLSSRVFTRFRPQHLVSSPADVQVPRL